MDIIGFIKYRYVETREFFEKILIAFRAHRNLRLVLCCDMVLQEIPFSTIFPHPYGISIRGGTKIGQNCVIRQNVTIGYRKDVNEKAPVVGNNVHICAGALIIGPVQIGNNATIGAGAIVLKDVPDNCTVVGIWK